MLLLPRIIILLSMNHNSIDLFSRRPDKPKRRQQTKTTSETIFETILEMIFEKILGIVLEAHED
jgi:hypothetical protein